MNIYKNKSIILFDGVCNLCNSSVNFIIKHDKKKYFLFASLQSDAAKEILLHHSLNKIIFDSIILIEDTIVYEKSTAVLRIAKKLNNGFQLLYIFILIPKILRDKIYDYIAKNRYKWYGKKNTCMLPSKDLKSRFL
ncbi:thiol-disulfide oxidoreductase DCC family protein [Lutibacter aestuarii]|uniref:Thiol-disulfide oxidoreductase DCC family protein n=1 Tax=Lutibacter aestuarii TaxID=861111 RepID=A0ABW2Z7V1_9FLAO|nr:thiol-disulfide oxidoreductase DCC family protein [uncultured Lutibacter sp.]